MTESMRLYYATVARTRQLTPHMSRITLASEELRSFRSAGADQRFKLVLPRGRAALPRLTNEGSLIEQWRSLPENVRPVLRTYTIRQSRPQDGEIDVDIVIHGDAGPGSAWAANAREGERVAVYGVRADYDPPADTEWVLLAGDESALPAIAAILDEAPADLPLRVFLEVVGPDEEQPLRTGGTTVLRWCHRGDAPAGGRVLEEAIRGAELPSGIPYAWIACESGALRGIRSHLSGERGLPAPRAVFTGYWRRDGAIDPD